MSNSFKSLHFKNLINNMKRLGIINNNLSQEFLLNQNIDIIENLNDIYHQQENKNLKLFNNNLKKNINNSNIISLMSYNIHKGKSFFMRKNVLPELKNVINHINSDIVFLQEVKDFSIKEFNKTSTYQTNYLSNNYNYASYGKNSIYQSGHHGNSILSKYPTLAASNFSLTLGDLEQRGVLYNKLLINNKTVHIFCTHLNLRKKDRFIQIKIMENFIDKIVLNKNEAIIIAGDFNDFDGSIDQYFKNKLFQSIQQEQTFPNIYPMFSLDKIFIKNLKLIDVNVYKDKSLYTLSDHLPIIARLEI